MTIHTLPLNTDEITRKLLLAYHCSHVPAKLGAAQIGLPMDKTPATPETIRHADAMGQTYYLVRLFSILAVPFVGLSSDGTQYVCDFDIPWGVINGKVTVVDTVAAAVHIHELVGDLSEGLLACSYNEDDIRGYWREGSLNKLLEECKDQLNRVDLDTYMPADRDIQSLVTFLMKQSRQWPISYGHNSASPTSNLTRADLAVIDKFDDVAYIKKQHLTTDPVPSSNEP